MAPRSFHDDHADTGQEPYANGNGPPPSTLAAQLVQNIGGSAVRSSREDENEELRRLISAIEKFKDQPELLRTLEERVEHNHLLIYVSVRHGLENLQQDNPFADRSALRSKIVSSITFVRVTIKETPEVLRCVTDGNKYLYRGTEPLWLWLLPKVLNLLGKEVFKDLTPVFEEFCRFLIPHAEYLGLEIKQYFLGLAREIVSQLESSILEAPGNADKKCNFEVPSRETIPSLNLTQPLPSIEGCSYHIVSTAEAFNHSLSLVSILARTFTSFGSQRFDPASSDLVISLMEGLNTLLWLYDIAGLTGKSYSNLALQNALVVTTHLSRCFHNTPMDVPVWGKVHQSMAMICARISENLDAMSKSDKGSTELRETFCLCLLQLTKCLIGNGSLASFVRLKLCDTLEAGVKRHSLLTWNTDFEACTALLKSAASNNSAEHIGNMAKERTFESPRLAQAITRLDLPSTPDKPLEPAAKRRKITPDEPSDTPLVQLLLTRLARLLGASPGSDIMQLEETFLAGFEHLDDSGRCRVINLLGRIPCAADKTLKVHKAAPGKNLVFRCPLCSDPLANERPPSSDIVTKSKATKLLCALVQKDYFRESKRPRILAMIILRKFVFHSADVEFLDIETSPPGQWCVQSLQSSIRELRIASGRALALFLRAGSKKAVDEEIAARNTDNVFSLLRSICEKNKTNLGETCAMAWGQLGRVVSDVKLITVLGGLIAYLGNRELVISSTAYNEILNLAAAKDQTPKRLLQPYWKELAFPAVRNLVTNPQITRLVAELLQKSISEFVLGVQEHAVPALVLSKRKEVVQKIADFRGEKEVWRTCIANLSHILPILLLQPVESEANRENLIMSQFRHVSPHFNKLTLPELVAVDPVTIVLGILKFAGESSAINKTRVRTAVERVAASLPEFKSEGKVKRQLSAMLEKHALGMTTRLADGVNETAARSSPVEQRRCINAMREFIELGKTDIRMARPQISAFLLSVLEFDEVRAPAFTCWAAMLEHFDHEDVEALLETTFFIIKNYWPVFDQASKDVCKQVILNLLQNHQPLLEDKINELPSFNHIPALADLERKLNALRTPLDQRLQFDIFAKRVAHENSGVVFQALTELAAYLQEHQGYLQTSAISEQPDSVITHLARALLDCSAKYQGVRLDIASLCVKCIGLTGCIDPNRIETVREQKQFVLLHNFEEGEEISDFGIFILENVLVPAFLSTSDIRFQGFLSYTMQEILERCDFKAAMAVSHDETAKRLVQKWENLPEATREVLKPFMTSQYRVGDNTTPPTTYPIFRKGKAHVSWIKSLTSDLLSKGQNNYAQIMFEPLSRVIKMKEAVVAEFLLPYLVVHIMVGGLSSSNERDQVIIELLEIVQYDLPDNASYAERENMKLFYESVFSIIDYANLWLQKKRALPNMGSKDADKKNAVEIARVQELIDTMPPDLMARRAVFCDQYARALFFLEPYIERQEGEDGDMGAADSDQPIADYLRAYAEIDDPDGMEGILASMNVTDMEWQILGHRKAGRWTAAQTWYEVQLAQEPDNTDHQMDLLTCLRESGQYDVLLNHVDGMTKTPGSINKIVPIAVEASWATGRWAALEKYLGQQIGTETTEVFNLGIAQALLHLKNGNMDLYQQHIHLLREKVASSLSYSVTNSLKSAHDASLKAHILTDLEIITTGSNDDVGRQQQLLKSLDRRFEVIGAYVTDKQYLLGIRRAAMSLMGDKFAKDDISSMWLSSARLARKSGLMQQSFNAVIHAQGLGDRSAPIENAKLLWKERHHRKAIQMLEFALKPGGAFLNPSKQHVSSSADAKASGLVTARARLLHAKWLDAAGQSSSSSLRIQYQDAAKTHAQWEKGHYYLGRHYKKILEAEMVVRVEDQTDEYLTGETAKLVVENYLRSLNFGTKYLYQTLPRILTLWLELGGKVNNPREGNLALSAELINRRKDQLRLLHAALDKHIGKLAAYMFYTALPQIVARIAHPNNEVFARLEKIIIKVVNIHPRQAIWSLMGVMSSKIASTRRSRGMSILNVIKDRAHKIEGCAFDHKQMIRMGDKLANQMLMACNNGEFQSNRTTRASLSRDLMFNPKCIPCPLVVPIEKCLVATLPTSTDNVRTHKAFTADVISIHKVEDEVLVLGSLAKPRRLTVRGTDGEAYQLLIKPKDDLRTDQRLMEFNGTINRALKRDALCSRRQLYVRTYAVTPLNEECGIIEWIDGLKTLRDILLGLYKARGTQPNYAMIAQLMKESLEPGAPENMFRDEVLTTFPPVLQQWFVQQFPAPAAWFAARLRYTRSCAVMSMLGTILGLGDRHGENVLLEVGNGGIFHVDFNCLFDKGLTFAQPERVPFRLTHNMQAAMGRFEHEGPFRRCAELTLEILRVQEETLMTILEAFIYDPTLDLQKEKKAKKVAGREVGEVRLNPQAVVDSIKRKVRGLLPEESIPLSAEGQVDELIKQATSQHNLASMYIGWCPFL